MAHLLFSTQPRPTSPLPRAGPPASWPCGLRPAHLTFPSPPSLPALVFLPRASWPSAAVLHARSRLTEPPPISRAMARGRPATRSLLTPPLLAASASPSFSNQRAPPSMVPPSLHHRPVASLPLGTYKSRPGCASPHLTSTHTTLLSSTLAPELTPIERLQPLSCCLVTRPPRRRSPSGEALDGTPVLHFPSPAPWPSA
jgi:hypothetical protein